MPSARHPLKYVAAAVSCSAMVAGVPCRLRPVVQRGFFVRPVFQMYFDWQSCMVMASVCRVACLPWGYGPAGNDWDVLGMPAGDKEA